MDWIGELLALALLASVTLLVPATVGIFTVSGRGSPAGEDRPIVAAALVAALVLAGAAAYGARPAAATIVASLLGGSVLAWQRLGRSWATRGVVAWALTLDAGLAYLAYVAWWMTSASVGTFALVASGVLWLLEAFVFVLALGYVWELVDVLTRRAWRRVVDLDALDPEVRPFVSLHVPAHNEPPDLVIATLQALLELDYDAYEILMIDDNTEDESLWRPVEAFSAAHERVRFFHLEDWPGYKSGALNFALTVTDPRAEVVGVVDADYVVQPDFLARCAPVFADRELAFLQTPQDYRDWEVAPYFRRLYHSYGYFFDVSQRSRNEVDAAIFGGTMGLIRRTALEEVGGWDEWCITEDAELSLRLLAAGWTGQHLDESFGHGIMPLTFEALKRQRFRWCFGGVQILRMHWRLLMPWNKSVDNKLSLGQRWAYFVGALQWFGDLAGMLFTAFLLVGAADLVLGGGLVVRRLQGVLLVCLVVLVLLGALRSLALLKRTRDATWRESIGAFGLWLGLGWAVALGAARGSVAREGAFLRTPKLRGELGWLDTLKGNRVETLLAVACLTVAGVTVAQGSAASSAVAALLSLQGLAFASAPINSWAAIHADLTPELRRRRQLLPSWTRGPRARRLTFWPLVGSLGIGVVSLVLAAPASGPLSTDLPSRATGGADPVGTPDRTKPIGPAGAVSPTVGTPAVATTTAVPGSPTPSASPTATPSASPTKGSTKAPTPTATALPTRTTGQTPTAKPTVAPGKPTTSPTNKPTAQPTRRSTHTPTPGPRA